MKKTTSATLLIFMVIPLALFLGCAREGAEQRMLQAVDPLVNISEYKLDRIMCQPREMLVGTRAVFKNLNRTPKSVKAIPGPQKEYEFSLNNIEVKSYLVEVGGLDTFVSRSRQKLINAHTKKSAANKQPVVVNLTVRGTNTEVKSMKGTITPKRGSIPRGYYVYDPKQFEGKPLSVKQYTRGPATEVEVDMPIKGAEYYICRFVFAK